MVAARQLALLVIAVAVLVLLIIFNYVGEGSSYEKAKKVFKGVVEGFEKTVSLGAKEISAEVPTVPKEHAAAIKQLAKTIKQMKDSPNQNCFANYRLSETNYETGGLPDFGKQGTVIDISKGSMVVRTLGGKQANKELTNSLIDSMVGVQPCVVAGNSDVVKNFYDSFLNTNSWDVKKQNIKPNHYKSVETLSIANDDSGILGLIENRISYKNENMIFNDFHDGGFLYKPDGQHICFFPTVSGLVYYSPVAHTICDGDDKDGLDDDCLLNNNPFLGTSIPRLIQEGKLLIC